MYTLNITSTKRVEPSKVNENFLGKKLRFPINGKNEKKMENEIMKAAYQWWPSLLP